MTLRRIGSAVAVLAALAVVAVIGVSLAGDDDEGEVEVTAVSSDARALSVADAINRAETEPFAVRGYVYDDGAFVQLCNGLTVEDPPRCAGPSALLKNLDLARLPIEEDEIDGRTVYYTAEPVILGGTMDGTQLTVVEVLAEAPAEEPEP